MQKNQKISVTKKIGRKKRKWYFRYKKITLKTVLKNISFYTVPWFYAGKPRYREVAISREKVESLVAIPADELDANRMNYVRLTIVDLYILYCWINLGLVNFSKFKGFKMYAFDCPLVKSIDERDPDNYHYLCLEENQLDRDHWLPYLWYKGLWQLHVRSREFITGIPEPYLVLCFRTK